MPQTIKDARYVRKRDVIMKLWAVEDLTVEDIAHVADSTPASVKSIVTKLRKEGVSLERRGNRHGRMTVKVPDGIYDDLLTIGDAHDCSVTETARRIIINTIRLGVATDYMEP